MRKGQTGQGPNPDTKDSSDVTLGGQLSVEQMTCRLDVVFGEAYRSTVEANEAPHVLAELCQGLVDALGLHFIWIAERTDETHIVPIAVSSEGVLARELARVPEHDDDSVLGNGPVAIALRQQSVQHLKVDAPGFQPWAKAARQEKIAALLSVPMNLHGAEQAASRVMVFATDRDELLSSKANQSLILNVAERVSRVCKSLQAINEMRMVNEALAAAGNAAFITDTQGVIQWANEAFSRLTGHKPEAVIGRNPRILKSGKQGFRYYNRLWRTISSGKIWAGETVDRDSRGELYTIRQTVSPVMRGEKITHYLSIHDDISDEKAMQRARDRARRVDEMTGLMTTGMFSENYERAVSTAVSHGEPLALILLTINDFDSLMASLGRDIEELVLETLGERIRCSLQEGDFAANLSSGDFAVVLTSVNSREQATAMGEEMLEVLNEPFPLLGDKLYLSRGLGVAFVPEDGNDADELMRVADARAGGSA